MAIRRNLTVALSTMLATTALSPVALAQEPEEDPIATLDVITVTAQRREQSIVDVPISVTAVTGADLDARGVEQLRDLQYSIPGLSIADRGPGTGQIQLRGVSQFVGSPTVGTYIDELSIAPGSAGTALSPQLLDLARVEVLRGPQPALYGESSMGGTIRYITADPVLDEVSGRLGAETATTDGGEGSYRLEGVLNLPIATDKLGVRLAGSYENAGGWIDTPDGDNANGSTIYSLRAKVRFEPTDRVSVSLLAMTQSMEEDDSTLADINMFNPAPGRAPSRDQFDVYNLVSEFDLGFATFLSSTGRIDREGAVAIDQSDFTIGFSLVPLAFGGLGRSPGDITEAVVFADGQFERTSQELRLTSNGDNRFNWLIGGTYIDDERVGNSFSVTAPTPTSALAFDLFGAPATTNTSEFWTLYAQGDYALSEALTVSLGGRYFEDERSRQIAPGAPFQTATFDSFNPRVNLTYDFDRGIVFFTAAKGFRSGGFNNTRVPPAFTPPPASFGPEELWTYEVGMKQYFFDSKLLIDAALYYNDWSDVQQTLTIAPGVPIPFTANGGAASGFGVDFAAQLVVSDELRLGATVGWTDMAYDTASATHVAGDPLDLVPEWTASVSVDYRKSLANGVIGFARGDLGYTDGSQNTLRNLPSPPFDTFTFVDGRTIINLKAGAEFERFKVYGFVENALNDDGTTYPAIGTVTIPARGRPVTFGLGLDVTF